jgi:hypothetical protein
MRVADHVIDTLDTRFAGVQALATVTMATVPSSSPGAATAGSS